MILPIYGGIVIDRIGLSNGLLLFSAILCIGQGIFTLGGSYRSYSMMLAGRFIYGIGSESMYVGQAAIVS